MDRVLRSTAPTIQLTIYDSSGTAIDATGSVTYSVKDSAGTVVNSGTATHGTIGVYTFVQTAANTANLDVYTVTWSATVSAQAQTFTTTYEVVGGFLFSIADLRAFDAALVEATYPAASVESARAAAEERLEKLCRVAFVPRGRRYTTSGDGTTILSVPDVELRTVISATISDGTTWTALTSPELADLRLEPFGLITRFSLGSWTPGVRNVSVLYEYGYDQPPEPVKRAAMALARNNLVGLSLFDRARSEAVDGGILSFTLAGRDGPTGIPEVDAVIAQFGRTVYAF